MSPRRALVTGAAGFIGANLVRALLEAGHDVVAVERPGGSSWRIVPLFADVRRVAADLVDGEQVTRVLRDARPEWVFHLAAHGAYSWQLDRARIIETNLYATLALLDAAADVGVETFIHAGSSSEYGFKDHAPTEDEALAPNSDYAAAKACASLFVLRAYSDGKRACTLRLYSAYGPWEEPKRFIPTLVAHATRGALPPLVNPDVAHDFVYIDDVCRAFLAAAENPNLSPVYNVASGEATTMREVVATAQRIFEIDEDPQWGSMADRLWDTSTWIGDARRLRREVGWHPRVSLEEGLRATERWLREATELHGRRYGFISDVK